MTAIPQQTSFVIPRRVSVSGPRSAQSPVSAYLARYQSAPGRHRAKAEPMYIKTPAPIAKAGQKIGSAAGSLTARLRGRGKGAAVPAPAPSPAPAPAPAPSGGAPGPVPPPTPSPAPSRKRRAGLVIVAGVLAVAAVATALILRPWQNDDDRDNEGRSTGSDSSTGQEQDQGGPTSGGTGQDQDPEGPGMDPSDVTPPPVSVPVVADQTFVVDALQAENGISREQADELYNLYRQDPKAFIDLMLSPGSGGVMLEVGEERTTVSRNLIQSAGTQCGRSRLIDALMNLPDAARCLATAEWARATAHDSDDERLQVLRNAEIAAYAGMKPDDLTIAGLQEAANSFVLELTPR